MSLREQRREVWSEKSDRVERATETSERREGRAKRRTEERERGRGIVREIAGETSNEHDKQTDVDSLKA